MGKHDRLTEKEFAGYSPPTRVIEYLEKFLDDSTWEKSEIRVLDWGCGRGRDVLWLRERGFEAFGVDIDSEPINNALPLIEAKGYSPTILRLLDDHGKTTFPDHFFHFIFSGNVIEHVKELGSTVAELGRITASGGNGYHIFPAHRQITEGHLFMPFIHWFPRGIIRRMLILAFVYVGREPDWEELKELNPREKAAVYYKYSVDHLHYRRYVHIRKVFQQNGFQVQFETIHHPDLKESSIVSSLINIQFFRSILHHLLLTYKLVELLAVKG